MKIMNTGLNKTESIFFETRVLFVKYYIYIVFYGIIMICVNFTRNIRFISLCPNKHTITVFFSNAIWCYLSLSFSPNSGTTNPRMRPVLSAVPSGGTHVRVHVSIRRASGAGLQFSRNDQRESNYTCVSTNCSLRNRNFSDTTIRVNYIMNNSFDNYCYYVLNSVL